MKIIDCKEFYKMGEQEKNQLQQNFFKEHNQLSEHYLASGERGIKALALVNGGGIVVILAYLHQAKPESIFILISLGSFVLGLLFFLLLTVLDFRLAKSALKNFHEDVRKFYGKNLRQEEMRCYLPVDDKMNVIFWVGYCSLGLGVVGIFLGLCGFFLS